MSRIRTPEHGRLRPWLRWGSVALAALLVSVTWPTGLQGQEVRFTPRPDRPIERQLDEFLRAGAYRLLSRDTVLAPADTVAGNVLVLDATVRSSGHVQGDVFVVGGDLFLRPQATVDGGVTAMAGGLYTSGEARVEGSVTHRPNLLLRVVPREGGWEIFHVREEPSPLELHGLSGFHAPAYRRVDGWTFGWGARVRATGVAGQPSLDGALRVHTRGSRILEGSLSAAVHPTGGTRVTLTGERRTRTRDGWIRGELANTASYLLGLGDLRNYYRAERAELRVTSTARQGWAPFLSVQWEEASRMTARPLGVLFADDAEVRPNPPVDEGRIVSLGAGLAHRRRSASSRFMGRLGVEAADSTVAGDFSFLLAEARLAWRQRLSRGHRLELRGLARWDATGELPRQRWSALGGGGSLPALGTLTLRGPRLAFLSATWLVPVEPLRLPVLGTPWIFVRNAAGTAWSAGEAFGLEDNVMAGVRFLFLEAGLAADVVGGGLEPELVIGAEFPGGLWD